MNSKFSKLSAVVLGGVILASAQFAFAGSSITNLINNKEGLSKHILQLGINAYHYAEVHGRVTKPYLVIADLSMLSKYKRLWIINVKTDKIVEHTYVANGKNSGLFRGTRFSNTPRSLQSSLGVYTTGPIFYGNDGISMRINGLEPGINSNAYSREVVFHGAWYVSQAFVNKYGRVGRSWGCFALPKSQISKVAHMINDGSVVFAYAPQENHDPAVA